MLQNQGDDIIEEDRMENQESRLVENIQISHDNHSLNNNQDNNNSSNNNSAQQQQPPGSKALQHRPSFLPPFPVQTSQIPSATLTPSLGGTPLTNHEIYELTQRTQQLQQVVGAAGQLGGGGQNQPVSGISTGSFKQSKRQSLYNQNKYKTLERQGSVIVGTPGFRERYGK